MGGLQRLVAPVGKPLQQLVGQKAEFGLLTGHMHLHQHRLHDALFKSLAVDFLKKTVGIDALYHGGAQAQQLLYFIGLQMANEVPLPVGVAEHSHFLRQFLHTAFAETALTGVESLAECFHGVEFGDCHKLDPLGKRVGHLPQP